MGQEEYTRDNQGRLPGGKGLERTGFKEDQPPSRLWDSSVIGVESGDV